jgi:hypothetical protein
MGARFDLRLGQVLLGVALGSACFPVSGSEQAATTGISQQTVHPSTEARYKISGTVVDALTSAPLAQTRVTLVDTRNRGEAIWTVTSENGRFEFVSLPAGKFALQGARRKYLRAAYDQHGQYSTAIVTGAGLVTENLALRLTPMAGIYGRVLDESGEPVRYANVMLYRQGDQDGLHRIQSRDRDTTDDQGFYEFSSVAPGKYFVSASGAPWYAVNAPHGDGNAPVLVDRSFDVVYPTTYYNGAIDSDAAAPIALRGGEHVQMDLHLNPVPALHVIFRIPEGEAERQGPPVLTRRAFDSGDFISPGFVQQSAPGIYELTGVPPGRYILQRPGTREMTNVGQLDLRADNQEVAIARPDPGASLTLTVKLPGAATLPGALFVALLDSERSINGRLSEVDATGHASITSLPPGKYSIHVFSRSGGRYGVTRMIENGREIAGREITMEPGSSRELSVVAAQGVVSVEGVVKRGGRPVAGAMVVLVPNNPEASQDLFRQDQSDLDGSFVVRDVIPGSYRVLALEDGWNMAWREPGALTPYLAKSQALTVGTLMQRTVVLPEAIESQSR